MSVCSQTILPAGSPADFFTSIMRGRVLFGVIKLYKWESINDGHCDMYILLTLKVWTSSTFMHTLICKLHICLESQPELHVENQSSTTALDLGDQAWSELAGPGWTLSSLMLGFRQRELACWPWEMWAWQMNLKTPQAKTWGVCHRCVMFSCIGPQGPVRALLFIVMTESISCSWSLRSHECRSRCRQVCKSGVLNWGHLRRGERPLPPQTRGATAQDSWVFPFAIWESHSARYPADLWNGS